MANELLFYDEYSSRYFTADMSTVLAAEIEMKAIYIQYGCVSMNTFYARVGLPPIMDRDTHFRSMGVPHTWLDFYIHETIVTDNLLGDYTVYSVQVYQF